MECVFGVTTQRIRVDGIVELLGIQAKVLIKLQLLPKPIIVEMFEFKFFDVVDYQLHVELVGAQHVLECIRDKLLENLNEASQAVNVGIEYANKNAKEAGHAMQVDIDKMEDMVNKAHIAYHEFSDTVHRNSRKIIDDFEAEVGRLQENIQHARNAYNASLEGARRAVEQASSDRAATMEGTQMCVNNARHVVVQGIDDAQRTPDFVLAEMERAFGATRATIEGARGEVQHIQEEIAIGTLEAARVVADATLCATQAVLHGPEFLAKEAAIDSARAILELARHGGYAVSLNTANAATADNKYMALQAAYEALEVFKNANLAAYRATLDAINTIIDGVEYIAYQSALRALDVAKCVTEAVDVATATLEAVKIASRFALDLTKDVVEWGIRALDIQKIHISGSLRGILGIEGSASVPLRGGVQGYILGIWFDIECEFNPRNSCIFIESHFKQCKDSGLGSKIVAISQEALILLIK
ncbi:hypothetical protein M422DRAFT_238622 [Sphaerobolus stellatus SS14]|nr:hypothetical protein M422DRAFT_238622 [Sphaerobolus stellatus SS14]